MRSCARDAIARLADCRFLGQAFELTVPLRESALDRDAVAELCRRFEEAHLTRYGHAFSGDFPVEIVNLRLVGSRIPQGATELRFVAESNPSPWRSSWSGR